MRAILSLLIIAAIAAVIAIKVGDEYSRRVTTIFDEVTTKIEKATKR